MENLSWCGRIENRLNSWAPELKIRPDTISEIAASAALSFTVNLIFNRNLSTSCKGAGIAVLAKLVQVTLTLAQQRLIKPAEEMEQTCDEATSVETTEALQNQQAAEAIPSNLKDEEPQTGIKYCLINYSTNSAAFVRHYLKKITPTSIVDKLTQSPIQSDHIYMLVSMGVFSYSPVQPWASLLSCWIYSKMTIDPNVGFFFEKLPLWCFKSLVYTVPKKGAFMSLVSSYDKSTANLEKLLNELCRFQLPKGSIKGVVSSFGVSLVINLIFLRTLESSLRGASIAATFKLTEIVLHLGLEHFYEEENPLLPHKKFKYPYLNIIVPTAGLLVFNKISAVWTNFATIVCYLALNNSTYIAFTICVILKS
jgi:hypothetical protein